MTDPQASAQWPGLRDRTAIVTGGSRNMGRAFALGLADAGAHVAVLDLPAQAGAAGAVVDEVIRRGRRARFVPLDVRDTAAIETAVSDAEEILGPATVLVNNAALTDDEEVGVLDYSPQALDANHAVTVRGTFFVTQAVARRLVATGNRGSIVNIASRVGQQVQSGSLGYAIAKAAVIHMTRVMALDLGPRGIRVNAIGPGPIPRPESGGAGPGPERFLLGRPMGYQDMVGTALYLASDASEMVTGQFIIVDGGLGLRPAY